MHLRIRSLRSQYAVAAVAVFSIGFVLAGLISHIVVENAAQREQISALNTQGAEALSAFDGVRKRTEIYAQMISRKKDFVRTIDKSEENERLSAVLDEFETLRLQDPTVATFEVTNAIGIVLARGHNPSQRGDDKSALRDIQAAIDGKQTSGLIVSPSSGQATLGAVAPLTSSRGVIGTLRVGARASADLLAEIKARSNGDVALLFKGKVVLSTLPDAKDLTFAPELIARTVQSGPQQTRLSLGSTQYLARMAALPAIEGEGLVLVAFQDVALFGRQVEAFRASLLSYALLALPVMLLAGLGLGHLMARPPLRAAQAMKDLSEGRFASLERYVWRHDEIGDMARAFGSLTGEVNNALRLRQTVNGMPTGVMTLDRAAGWRIDYVNPALKRELAPVATLLPVALDAMTGETANTLFPDAGLTGTRLESLPPEGLRLPFTMGDATFMLTIATVVSRNGEPLGAMVAFENVTERQRLAAQFEHAVMGVAQRVDSSTQDLRRQALDVRDNVATVQTQAEQVARASEESSSSVTTVAAAADELLASIEEIRRQISDSAEVTGRARAESERIAGVMVELSEASLRIGSITQTIGTIAAQTNLLALNATIEAARAGEAGRGFAVVAAEVKALAAQTSHAAEEVVHQVQAIQSRTGAAVDAITAVAGTIQDIVCANSGIAAAVEQQRSATGEIAQNTLLTANGTNEVATSITEVSAASRTTGDASEAMLASSDDLRREVETLKREVEAFLSSLAA